MVKQVPTNLRDTATALIKFHGIHEGWWRVYFEFGVFGTNMNKNGQLAPAAMVPIIGMGLLREKDEAHSTLAVDAAVVNPKSRIITDLGRPMFGHPVN